MFLECCGQCGVWMRRGEDLEPGEHLGCWDAMMVTKEDRTGLVQKPTGGRQEEGLETDLGGRIDGVYPSET